MASVPGLFQSGEGLVVQLRDACGGDGEKFRDFPEGDVLQIVESDDGCFAFGQAAQTLKDDPAVFVGKHAGVGTGGGGIGESFGEREVFLAVVILGDVIERNDLAGLGVGLVGDEIGFLHAQGFGEFGMGGFTIEAFCELRCNTYNTPLVFMNRTGRPFPMAQLIQDRATNPKRTITTEGGSSISIVPGGGTEVAEDACALEILMTEVSGQLGGAGTGDIPRPRQEFEESGVFVIHNGLLM